MTEKITLMPVVRMKARKAPVAAERARAGDSPSTMSSPRKAPRKQPSTIPIGVKKMPTMRPTSAPRSAPLCPPVSLAI